MEDRIVLDPKICHGMPTIKGTRVLVSNILGALSTRQTFEEILEDYPNITREDISAALKYRDGVIDKNNLYDK